LAPAAATIIAVPVALEVAIAVAIAIAIAIAVATAVAIAVAVTVTITITIAADVPIPSSSLLPLPVLSPCHHPPPALPPHFYHPLCRLCFLIVDCCFGGGSSWPIISFTTLVRRVGDKGEEHPCLSLSSSMATAVSDAVVAAGGFVCCRCIVWRKVGVGAVDFWQRQTIEQRGSKDQTVTITNTVAVAFAVDVAITIAVAFAVAVSVAIAIAIAVIIAIDISLTVQPLLSP
jgi:hypothetical protein